MRPIREKASPVVDVGGKYQVPGKKEKKETPFLMPTKRRSTAILVGKEESKAPVVTPVLGKFRKSLASRTAHARVGQQGPTDIGKR